MTSRWHRHKSGFQVFPNPDWHHEISMCLEIHQKDALTQVHFRRIHWCSARISSNPGVPSFF